MIVFAVNERRSPAESRNGNSAVELREELLQRELHAAARRADAREALRPVVDGEDDRALAREQRVEERVARLGPREARAREGGAAPLRGDLAEGPDAGALGQAFGQEVADRAVEHDRGQPDQARVGARELQELGAEGRAALEPGGAELLHGLRRHGAERLHEPRVELGLGEEAVLRRHQGLPQVEVVVRELEVEEGGLRLLELARHREHVVGEPRGLGHGHVDHDDELERRDRLAHARAVRERMGRVPALDEERAEALRVVGQDLLGDHVAGREPANHA
jgi:hypothetical protein